MWFLAVVAPSEVVFFWKSRISALNLDMKLAGTLTASAGVALIAFSPWIRDSGKPGYRKCPTDTVGSLSLYAALLS